MASTSDIRDIMNLGQAGPRQPAPKKKKIAESQPRVTGVRREVQALMGDSVPPIAIVEQRSYKSRPSISQKLFKPRHWEERPFQHGGRTDGLVLRHWKRSIPGTNARPLAVANGSTDVEMTEDAKTAPAVQELNFEEEYPSEKWNVTVEVPSYTDEQYESMLKSDDWSRQETDYLVGLCRDYDLRWIVIADRYTPDDIPKVDTPVQNGEPNGTEVVAASKSQYVPRSMEALKQRYYAIAAKMMEVKTPASTMTSTEFQLWEKMRNFDAKTEVMRKSMAEKLFERTKDEADEERILLEELHRITKNEDDFIKMRRELYSRLEPVAPLRRSGLGEEQSTALYQTSGGLSMLLQNLLAKEKRLKRPPIPEGAAGHPSATAVDSLKHDKGRQSSQYSRRDTMDTQATGDDAAGSHKKGSASQAPTVRILSPQDEARFGVSHPQERITSGVQFRHEKINRLTMAKSQSQTTKIQAALTELGIPPRLLMPTERVCREFERLVQEINILLDSRKLNEKIANEIKILEEARRLRLGLPKEGEQSGNTDAAASGGAAAGPAHTSSTSNGADVMEIDDSQIGDESRVESTMNDSMAVAEEDQDAEAEDDELPEKPQSGVRNANDESTMQVDGQTSDGDAEAEDDEGGTTTVKPTGEDEDDDDEDENEEENGEEDDDEQEVTGIEQDDEDQDDNQGRVDADDDEDDEEDAEVAPTPQDDSEAEEEDEDEDDDQDEVQPQAEVESEEEDEADINEEESEAEARVAHQDDDEDDDEEEEEDEDEEGDEDEAAPDSGPAAQNSDDDEEEEAEDEDEDEEDKTPPSQPAVRAHKRSASVISEASRAGSNRSGLGRKKRR